MFLKTSFFMTNANSNDWIMASMIRYERSYTDFFTHLHPLEASDVNFQTIWITKVILAKFLSQKIWSGGTIFIVNVSRWLVIFRFGEDWYCQPSGETNNLKNLLRRMLLKIYKIKIWPESQPYVVILRLLYLKATYLKKKRFRCLLTLAEKWWHKNRNSNSKHQMEQLFCPRVLESEFRNLISLLWFGVKDANATCSVNFIQFLLLWFRCLIENIIKQ